MIVVIGNINFDIIARTSRSENREENRVTSLRLVLGGTAANTAVQLSRLGNEVALIGAVGDDLFGDWLIKELENRKVYTKGIKKLSTYHTGLCFANVADKGERYLYTYRGANEAFIPELSDFPESELYYLAGLSVKQAEHVVRTLEEKSIFYSPGGIVTFESPERVLRIARNVDTLFLNEAEWGFLKEYGEPKAKRVIVTRGHLGSTSIKDGIKAPAYKIDVVDTTGAGDAFAAGFIHALLREENAPIEDCLSFGNVMGAMVCSHYGATGEFTIRDIRKFIEEREFSLLKYL